MQCTCLVAALAACEFPSKVGDLEETGSGGQPGGSTSTMGATGSGGAEDTATTTSASTMGATGSGGVEGSTSTTTTMGATGSGGVDDSASTTTTIPGFDLGGVDCVGLDEAACAATPGCKAVRGNEHVFKNGGACVDDKVLVFLACDVDIGACPPFIPTVCPEGQVKPQFDVPSGCIPPGFENCEPDTTQPCP